MFKLAIAVSTLLIGLSANTDCPVDREQQCVDEFRQALPYCKKASESKGSDRDADLNCLKYAYQM